MSAMVSRKTGAPSTSASQKRRVMSTSSGFGSSSSRPTRGSSAIPQIGQAPGCVAHDFRVHRAGVFDLHQRRRIREVRLERHAALRARRRAPPAGSPDPSGRRSCARPARPAPSRPQRAVPGHEFAWRGLESLEAAGMAEVIGLPPIADEPGGLGRVDAHPADRVDVFGCRRRGRGLRHRVLQLSSASMIGQSSAAPSRHECTRVCSARFMRSSSATF